MLAWAKADISLDTAITNSNYDGHLLESQENKEQKKQKNESKCLVDFNLKWRKKIFQPCKYMENIWIMRSVFQWKVEKNKL